MSRSSALILLGILVILTPFSGFPLALRSTGEAIFGILIFGIGVSFRMREARKERTGIVE